ncbi:MAG: hypothetical protein KF784_11460 [Fimbriimonadaceae bacterium]|nr:hypothetical protein [Fimbriimonadaceae bacterium]
MIPSRVPTSADFEALESEIGDYLSHIDTLPAVPVKTPEEIRMEVARAFTFDSPRSLPDLIHDAAWIVRDGIVHTPHPRYFGLYNTASLPAAIMADALAATFDSQQAAYSHSMACHEVEWHALAVFSDLLGWTEGGFSSFTSGGAESNLTGAICGLTWKFPSYAADGVHGLSGQPVFYVSEIAHDSFQKIAHHTGIGRSALRRVAVEADLRMSLPMLERMIAEDEAAGRLPFMVVGTAGTTASGIIDPLPELADLCEKHGLWLHVDGAWAAAAILSPKHRHVLDGIDGAHSLTFDAHKWLNCPMGAGMFFSRLKDPVVRGFGVQASYMPARVGDLDEPYMTTLQWSRRFIGLKVAMTMATFGLDGYAEMIDRHFRQGDLLRRLLRESGWEILNATPLPVVNFTHPRIESGAVSLEAALQSILETKECWLSIAPVPPDRRGLRACVSVVDTKDSDVERLVALCNSLI